MIKRIILPLDPSGVDKFRQIISSPYNTVEKRDIILPEDLEEGSEDVISELSIQLIYTENKDFPDMINYHKNVREFWVPVNPEKSRSAAVRYDAYESFMSNPAIEVLHETRVRFGVSYLALVEYIDNNRISDQSIYRTPKWQIDPDKRSRKVFDPVTQTYIIL